MALGPLDPAEFLPAELFQQVLSCLDSVDLTRATDVSKLWYRATADGVLWQSHCRERWKGKRYMRRVYRIGRSHM